MILSLAMMIFYRYGYFNFLTDKKHFKACVAESKTVPIELCRKILSKAQEILSVQASEKPVSRKV